MSMGTRRTALRGMAVGSVAVAAIGLGAAGAWAKSDISFSAGPHTVRYGSAVHLVGQGEDDNSTYNRYCVQQRSGNGGWVTLRCSRGGYNAGGSLNFSVRPSHRGQVQFRGIITEAPSKTSRHTSIHLASAIKRVLVS
ncbi:hypothetical protein AB0M29_41650 [Streptomyces sp. NPDC051976]|uniref:hypothetical protein n=1 Tax=Streptomyces sp. NPDC051976 TaxID=3154947 RepID=UPI00342BE9A6